MFYNAMQKAFDKFVKLLVILASVGVMSACSLGQGMQIVAPMTTDDAPESTVIELPTPSTTATEIPGVSILPTNTAVLSAGCVPNTSWPIYTVAVGDTLFSIAQRVNSTVAALTQANCLVNPNVIEVGQQIRVPSLPMVTALPPTLAVISYPGQPDPSQCAVFINSPHAVYIYSSPNSSDAVLGILGNYAPWRRTIVGGYEIALPDKSTGWVQDQNTILVGNCEHARFPGPLPAEPTEPAALPIVGLDGPIPETGCFVVRAATPVYIYGPGDGSGPIAILNHFARHIASTDNTYEIELPGFGYNGWVDKMDTYLAGGNCVS
jgi:LysM repeat protein